MLKLTKHLYACTITSLCENDMLKIDVSPGEYKLVPFEEGYVFTKTADFKDLDIVKVFLTRDGDKGLSGTSDYDGESDEANQIRLFKTWLCKRFIDFFDPETLDILSDYDSYDEPEDEQDERTEAMKRRLFKYNEYEARSFNFEDYNEFDFHAAAVKERRMEWILNNFKFGSYHNYPFIFYLNKHISNYDLLKLEETDPVENCGFLWKVLEDNVHIGYVVENKLHCMMYDQAGIAIFQGALAFGNFNTDNIFEFGIDSSLEDARMEGYKCYFDNCECDTYKYSGIMERNQLWKLRVKRKKNYRMSFSPINE